MPDGTVPIAAMVLLAVAALHMMHTRAERGFTRWWHGAHVAMSAGMIVMVVLPDDGADLVFRVMALAFGAHVAAMTIALPRVTGIDRRIWVAAVLDGLCMTYMLLPTRPLAVTVVAVVYLVAAAVAWAAVPGGLSTPQRAGGSATVRSSGRAVAEAPPRGIVGFAGDLAVSVRLTLTAMALAMAWMLLAMQSA